MRRGTKHRPGIGFGSQIRSYVLAPHTLVTDHRTGLRVNDVQSVLDGNLDPFIRAQLLGVSVVEQSHLVVVRVGV